MLYRAMLRIMGDSWTYDSKFVGATTGHLWWQREWLSPCSIHMLKVEIAKCKRCQHGTYYLVWKGALLRGALSVDKKIVNALGLNYNPYTGKKFNESRLPSGEDHAYQSDEQVLHGMLSLHGKQHPQG